MGAWRHLCRSARNLCHSHEQRAAPTASRDTISLSGCAAHGVHTSAGSAAAEARGKVRRLSGIAGVVLQLAKLTPCRVVVVADVGRGFDIFHLCSVSWYNHVVGPELALPFDGNLAVIVGNSKALWPPLLAHYR